MITATILAGFGIALAPQTGDANVLSSHVELDSSITLSLQIEETHLAVQSLIDAPQLMIFASGDDGSQAAFWLPPGARYEEDFPRGTLTGIELEVLTVTAGAWVTTGSLVLSDSLPSLVGGLWVLDCGHAVAQSEGAALLAATPAGSSLPPSFLALTNLGGSQEDSNAGDGHAPSFHVPVPTPTDRPRSNKPPKLRPKPLPPV